MTMSKFVYKWTGWVGEPGWSTFYVEGDLDNTQCTAAANALNTMFSVLVGNIPSVVKLSMLPTMQVIADGDGSLVHEIPIPSKPADLTGAASGGFSAVTGSCITWRTAHRGPKKPTTGRTFLIPLAQSAFQADGSMVDSVRTGFVTLATAYIGRVAAGVPGHPVVWHRNTPGLADGASYPVTTATVSDQPAYMKSRRV